MTHSHTTKLSVKTHHCVEAEGVGAVDNGIAGSDGVDTRYVMGASQWGRYMLK